MRAWRLAVGRGHSLRERLPRESIRGRACPTRSALVLNTLSAGREATAALKASRRAIVLALLGAAGLALYLWPALAAPVVRWSDSDVDLAWAREGAGILRPVWTPGHAAKPGYLLFLRTTLALSGGNPRGVVVLQSLLLVAAITGSALLLARRSGPVVALAFWLAAMLFLRIRDAASAVMSEPLAAALFLPAAVLALEPPRRTRGLVPVGALLGALFLVRPNLGATALLLVGLSLALSGRWSGLLVAVAVMAALAAPFWIATSPGASGDRARGLTYQMFEASADDYWLPSIGPPPATGTPAQISRELAERALARWRSTLAGSGPDFRRQLAWRALHGLLGAEFYDARWSPSYRRASSFARALAPFEVLAAIAFLLVLPSGRDHRMLAAGGLLLIAVLLAQNLALGSNPRYVLPFLPVLLLFGVCAAGRASPPRAVAALLVLALLCILVSRRKSVLGQEWGVLEATGVTLVQPIPRRALPDRAPATLHLRIAPPLVPTSAGLEVRDSASRLLYSSPGDAGRRRPEITMSLPQTLLDENRHGDVALRLTSAGWYDSAHYLLFPVIPRPWSAPAKREDGRELSPISGVRSGSLDWWAHPGLR